MDAGAYVLSAMDDREAAAFAAHLRTCEDCRREVAQLQRGADALALAAPQLEPPPALRERIMRELAPPAPAPRRRWSFGVRPLVAGALVAAGVAGGVVLSSEDDPGIRTLAAQAPPGASASLQIDGTRGTLRLAGMRNPTGGRVYQVWLVRGAGTPQPTHTLFTVRRDGRATVAIDAPVGGVREILVSAEPAGGSDAPTSAPVIRAVPA
jgi:anti-sigma factor RsiW